MKIINPDNGLAVPCPRPAQRQASVGGSKVKRIQAGGANREDGRISGPPAAFVDLSYPIPCRPRARPAWRVLADRVFALARSLQLDAQPLPQA